MLVDSFPPPFVFCVCKCACCCVVALTRELCKRNSSVVRLCKIRAAGERVFALFVVTNPVCGRGLRVYSLRRTWILMNLAGGVRVYVCVCIVSTSNEI